MYKIRQCSNVCLPHLNYHGVIILQLLLIVNYFDHGNR